MKLRIVLTAIGVMSFVSLGQATSQVNKLESDLICTLFNGEDRTKFEAGLQEERFLNEADQFVVVSDSCEKLSGYSQYPIFNCGKVQAIRGDNTSTVEVPGTFELNVAASTNEECDEGPFCEFTYVGALDHESYDPDLGVSFGCYEDGEMFLQ